MLKKQFFSNAEQYIDTVFRVAYNYLGSAADADDITQNVFLKLLQQNKEFASDDHVKNWLVRVTINQCKDLVRSRWWKPESVDDYASKLTFDSAEQSDLFYLVMALPKKYRLPIYLYYYEDYTTPEIAELLHIPKNTVYTNLRRGRELLKKSLQEAEYV